MPISNLVPSPPLRNVVLNRGGPWGESESNWESAVDTGVRLRSTSDTRRCRVDRRGLYPRGRKSCDLVGGLRCGTAAPRNTLGSCHPATLCQRTFVLQNATNGRSLTTPENIKTCRTTRCVTQATQEAERGGFEPPVPFGYTAFPVLHNRPLCHLSVALVLGIPRLRVKWKSTYGRLRLRVSQRTESVRPSLVRVELLLATRCPCRRM